MKKIPLKRCQMKGCTKIARREYEHSHDTTRYFCKRHFRQYLQNVMEQFEARFSEMSEDEVFIIKLLGLLKAGLI